MSASRRITPVWSAGLKLLRSAMDSIDSLPDIMQVGKFQFSPIPSQKPPCSFHAKGCRVRYDLTRKDTHLICQCDTAFVGIPPDFPGKNAVTSNWIQFIKCLEIACAMLSPLPVQLQVAPDVEWEWWWDQPNRLKRESDICEGNRHSRHSNSFCTRTKCQEDGQCSLLIQYFR